jgi:hypothetical protein
MESQLFFSRIFWFDEELAELLTKTDRNFLARGPKLSTNSGSLWLAETFLAPTSHKLTLTNLGQLTDLSTSPLALIKKP